MSEVMKDSMSNSKTTNTTSTVAYQVMWNRLISVVEEQAQALPVIYQPVSMIWTVACWRRRLPERQATLMQWLTR